MPSSYVIGKHYEKFIKDMIATGRYTNASEVIRDALRHFEETNSARLYRPANIEELKDAIAFGASSGEPVVLADAMASIDRELAEFGDNDRKNAA